MTREGRKIHTTPHARFVALLFAVAATCEFAAYAPSPVRRAMLYFLVKAEAISHSIVYWAYRDCGASFSWAVPGEVRTETCPQAALGLADWFRTLAIALRDLPRRTLIEKHRRATSLSTRLSRGSEGQACQFSTLYVEGLGEADGWGCLRQRGPPDTSPLRGEVVP